MITPRNRNAGTSVQNSSPKSSASSGRSAGSPIQAASVMREVSKMPSAPATTQPTRMPAIGPQKRSSGERRSVNAAATTIVTNAVSDACSGSTCVASSSRSKTTEARVIERDHHHRAAPRSA